MSPSKRAIALYLHPGKPDVHRVLPALQRFLKERGVNAFGFREQSLDLPPTLPTLPLAELARRTRFALVLGGDGTFLRAARALRSHNLPILGIRLGRTGFLTALEVGNFRRPLTKILAGEFSLDRRSMVEARVLDRRGRLRARGVALNDIVLKQLDYLKVVRLRLALDDAALGEFTADGLVVATPTGATAYSLSAGGPVVEPSTRVLVATLLCPHTISSRPLVFEPSRRLAVQVERGDGGVRVILDGQEILPLEPGQTLVVTGARQVVRVVRPPGYSYPELLQSRLGWKS